MAGIRVEGADQLRRQLRALPAQVREGCRQAIRAAAVAVQADEQAAMRVDTGAARAGIRIRMAGDGLSAEVGVSDPELRYVIFLEFGTGSIPAQPWATPAAEAERPRLPGRIERAVKARLR